MLHKAKSAKQLCSSRSDSRREQTQKRLLSAPVTPKKSQPLAYIRVYREDGWIDGQR